ncbi:MAG: hypothetical protein OJF51_000441 [Nitrospira sp.]|nr:MAG: hypothetical protein OJF51_000441 [Nitrospira sp.]
MKVSIASRENGERPWWLLGDVGRKAESVFLRHARFKT